MPVPPLPPGSGPADDRLVPRPLTAADWRAWADSAVVDLQGAWTFALHCPADPELRGHVAKVLRYVGGVTDLLRDTLAAMDRAEQSPFHPPAPDAAHDPLPSEPVTSAPSTAPRKAPPAQW